MYRKYTCCICGEEFEGFGNNAAPVMKGTCWGCYQNNCKMGGNCWQNRHEIGGNIYEGNHTRRDEE